MATFVEKGPAAAKERVGRDQRRALIVDIAEGRRAGLAPVLAQPESEEINLHFALLRLPDFESLPMARAAVSERRDR